MPALWLRPASLYDGRNEAALMSPAQIDAAAKQVAPAALFVPITRGRSPCSTLNTRSWGNACACAVLSQNRANPPCALHGGRVPCYGAAHDDEQTTHRKPNATREANPAARFA